MTEHHSITQRYTMTRTRAEGMAFVHEAREVVSPKLIGTLNDRPRVVSDMTGHDCPHKQACR
jgi:hypothetical protein